jgi:hypothetical protein
MSILKSAAFQRSDPERGVFLNPRSPNARDRGHPSASLEIDLIHGGRQ